MKKSLFWNRYGSYNTQALDMVTGDGSRTMTERRNTTLDLAKYIAALMVIGLHTRFLAEISETANFIVTQILFRVAVPFFAVCTGYLLAPKLSLGPGSMNANYHVIIRQERHLIPVYCIWTVLYLFFSIPKWIENGWFSAWAFVDYGIAAVRDGSHYHLWYLLDLIYAYPILLILLHFLNRNKVLPVSAALYLVYAIHYGYRSFVTWGDKAAVRLLFNTLPFGGGTLPACPTDTSGNAYPVGT